MMFHFGKLPSSLPTIPDSKFQALKWSFEMFLSNIRHLHARCLNVIKYCSLLYKTDSSLKRTCDLTRKVVNNDLRL